MCGDQTTPRQCEPMHLQLYVPGVSAGDEGRNSFVLIASCLESYQTAGGWRHTMALTSDGKLYGWGWNKFGQVGVGDNIDHCSPVQKVVQITCGWRHTLAVTERQNVFSLGRGTNGQLGHGESIDRNVPTIIESLSVDGSTGLQIESSKVDPATGKTWVSPSERYAVVPDETVRGQTSASVKGNGNDVNVPQSDVKRVRFDDLWDALVFKKQG
ncbi:hypothetical protein Prudu_013083 [Prunus dulcis]|uniref:Regulator of chromosome condensation family protein n=1 Tax=Prunus dulcis TaxID=3755 RepID=A0A4Y1RE17_PRUDU|nr:hypothetical protein Prudu_013083 [Prunus dulcis]